MRTFILWIMTILVSCTPIDKTPLLTATSVESVSPSRLIILGNAEMKEYANMWMKEIQDKYPTDDLLIFMCHGRLTGNMSWFISPDMNWETVSVETKAEELHKLFKDYKIFLVVCNPGKCHIKTPGVYYALANVWMVPDEFCAKHTLTKADWAQNITYSLTGVGKLVRETDKGIYSVGSVDEFVEGK